MGNFRIIGNSICLGVGFCCGMLFRDERFYSTINGRLFEAAEKREKSRAALGLKPVNPEDLLELEDVFRKRKVQELEQEKKGYVEKLVEGIVSKNMKKTKESVEKAAVEADRKGKEAVVTR